MSLINLNVLKLDCLLSILKFNLLKYKSFWHEYCIIILKLCNEIGFKDASTSYTK